MRDLLEAFGTFLDECYDIASCLRMIKQKSDGALRGQNWSDRQKNTLKYRRLGIDKKFDKGIVPDTYLDKRGMFRITWKRAALVAIGGQDREVQLGEVMNPGEGLDMRMISEHREFGREDRVRLEPVEFSGVCWTVFTAGDAIREALEKERSSISSI